MDSNHQDEDDFGADEAIPLVIFNEEKKIFELNEEGRQYLEKLGSPLGVVAVAGMYRTGKSYLLNRMLLDRSDGFGVGPTINPCTKGVWMWGRPVNGTTPEGDPIKVIILDTEGLGALDEDSNHDVRIFSLAILLSSFFIYNSVGSIDENALQNLSLVINLTKHIQIKSTGIHEDVDPEEFAKYFPSFMWVVRDFTLQLVDQEGEQISPKEYLEKALAAQKGFSDSIESKNRIRRLLKSFFHERDCVTMIRPLTNEERLQNLISIPLNELRPEFVDQVVNVRRKVLGRVKPKKINGKPLNGTMLWNLMTSYVQAINKGAIPSIESSWAYICRNECHKAVDDSYEIFVKAVEIELQTGGPFYDNELKDIYSSSKKQAIQHFTKVAVGEVKEEFMNMLRDKMKNKYAQIKQDNDHYCEQECLQFLRQSYTDIERALKNQHYPSFVDYLNDIEQFKTIFDQSGPPGTARREIMLEFCVKEVMDSAEFFMGNIHNELNLQRALAEETVKKLQEDLKEHKNEQKQKIENLETKMKKTELEKAEISAKEQGSREAYQQIQNEKQQLEQDLNQKIHNMKKDFERQIEEIQTKLAQAEDQKKDIQRSQVSAESEFDKQKALLEQKIEFLEKALEDSNKREKELSIELKNSKKDFLNQNKETTSALEKQIKDQQKQMEEMKEQIYEWENKNTELELAMEDYKSAADQQKQSLTKELKQAKDLEADITKKFEALKKKTETETQAAKNQQENEKTLNQQKITELETGLKDTQDAYEMAKQTWAKEQAVLQQKLEFVQYQLNDEKKKFEENKAAHESMLRSLQSTNRESVIGREEAQSKINEMEQKFLQERKKQEETYNEYRKTLTDQVETLKKKNNELELQVKVAEGEFQKDVQQLKEQLNEAEEAKNAAEEKLKSLNTQKLEMLTDSEAKFKQREQELEKLIEDKEEEIDNLIQESQLKSEKQLNEIKKFYEDEKDRLNQRLNDEKNRAEKKMNMCVEDYESKIQEMNNQAEDAYNALEDEKVALEGELNNLVHQVQVMQQQIESKDRYTMELKENLNALSNKQAKQNEQLADKFNKERKELNDRIEQQASEISKRERAILSLENAKDGYIQKIAQNEKAIEELKNESLSEKAAQLNKIEELKQKYDQAMDELTQSKINFERDKALKDQKLVFQEQRIKEYNDQQQQTIERYEERLKQEKEDAQKTLAERVQRIMQEKENVETKYEQKRKALKELEKQMQQVQSQNERDRAVQAEKYENLERSQQDLIKTYEIEVQKLQDSNDQLNQALSQGELGIREQVEHWKSQYYDMERQHADLQSELEKEKALWEGKFEFLEKQKEQAKKDNEDALKQFQTTVDQLQKSQNENKQKHEHNHVMGMQQMEQKFKKDMKEAQENAQAQITQLNNTIRKLEKENKAITERLELNSKSLMSEAGGLEKRLERTTEERDRLKEEFENVKADRDRKLDEMRRQFEREKEVLKQKNNDLTQKNKAIEGKQTELILSHETNRAKWDQEKSYLVAAKEDAISELKNIQKRQENSLKEIERLKEQQKRANWRQTKQATGGPLGAKVGEGILGRLNLGGAGGGLRHGPGDVSASTNFGAMMPKNEIGSYRQNLGMDKSVDNFKMGFGAQFGSQLGISSFGGNKDGEPQGGQARFGGMAQEKTQPQSFAGAMSTNNPLDNSVRGSNILSTPTSSRKQINDEEDDVEYDK